MRESTGEEGFDQSKYKMNDIIERDKLILDYIADKYVIDFKEGDRNNIYNRFGYKIGDMGIEELWIREINLLKIPEEIVKLQNLKVLEISSCYIIEFPNWVSRLRKLEVLDLHNNEISTINCGLKAIRHLEKIDLSFNDLRSIIDENTNSLSWSGNVKYLNLTHNNDLQFPIGIRNLTNLKELNLCYCYKIELPDWIGELTNLESLYLYGTNPELPNSIKNLSKLKILMYIFWDNVPDWISDLINLEIFYTSNTLLTSITQNFNPLKYLKNLKTMIIYMTNQIEIPDWIGDLKSIENIVISSKRKVIRNRHEMSIGKRQILVEFPGNLRKIKRLKFIELKHLYLDAIGNGGDELINLKTLILLNISKKETKDFKDRTIINYTNLDKLGKFTSLEILKLEDCKIQDLGDWIGGLRNLKYFELEIVEMPKEKIYPISEKISNLKFLKSLYIYSNNITPIPDSIGNLKNLRSLIILSDIYSIPNSIGKLQSLEELILISSNISELPDEIGLLTNLKKLILIVSPKLNSFPPSFNKLKSLEYFRLDSSGISKISSWIGGLQNLKFLELVYNKFRRIPKDIGRLKNLETLYLELNTKGSGNYKWIGLNHLKELVNLKNLHINILSLEPKYKSFYLDQVPDSIQFLKNLKKLYIKVRSNIGLELIGKLKNLEILHLYLKNITEIGDWIGNLENLKELEIKSKELHKISDSIGNLRNLVEFKLYSDKLSNLPDSFENLKNLRTLHLVSNTVEIGDWIGGLENLITLSFWDFREDPLKISRISDKIGNLKYLREINLEHCNLPVRDLKNFGSLVNLHVLNLRDTNIGVLYEELGNLKRLRILDLYGTAVNEVANVIKGMNGLRKLEIPEINYYGFGVDEFELVKVHKELSRHNHYFEIKCE
ncbi:MAG: leucine-rich repeat domain-containing protein [Candidatus Helarchaeota archaeon]